MINRDVATWLIAVTIIGLGIYMIHYINTESYKCLSNPYNYSISLLEQANNANISCLCSTDKINGPTLKIDTSGLHQSHT